MYWQLLFEMVNIKEEYMAKNINLTYANKNKHQDDRTLGEQSGLHVDTIIELLEVCLKTSYFQFGNKSFQQEEQLAVGISLSPVVSNIYVESSE